MQWTARGRSEWHLRVRAGHLKIYVLRSLLRFIIDIIDSAHTPLLYFAPSCRCHYARIIFLIVDDLKR